MGASSWSSPPGEESRVRPPAEATSPSRCPRSPRTDRPPDSVSMLYSWRDLIARNQGREDGLLPCALSNSPGRGCSHARLNYRSHHIRARIKCVRLLAAPISGCSLALGGIGWTCPWHLHHLFRGPAGRNQP